ncbi:MAG TPA: chromosomal replication initiator protein DnaA [Candidatus Omnitrophota bacterium]|nr:chromosomal replication initiator protein DnaA [Candidatus Omnitrophota bacterium]
MNNSLWDQICKIAQPKIGDTGFEAWLKPIRAKLDELNKILVLEAPNDFSRDWVRDHYDLILKDAIQILGASVSLDYKVNTTPISPEKAKKQEEKPAVVKEKPREGFVLNPKYTFENFIVGPSNRFTHAACLSIAESPAKAYNPLFIYGRAGLGKTHLMQAICHRIKQKFPHSRFYYTPSEKFTNDLISAIQHRSTQAFRDKFRNVDVLLIDDIHFIANKEATQEEFFHTFNALYDAHKQLIISSDRPPKEIQKLEERLVSRFGWGLVTDIQPPDIETRIAILRKKIENETIDIPDDVIFFIAETIKTNIRELEGALVRIIAYSLLQEEAITLDMAKNVLKDLLKETSKDISIEDIQKIVSEHFKINIADFKTKKRIKSIVMPRQIAMYLARELTCLSLPEIGQRFGGKDHTTILHAYKKIKDAVTTDPKLKNTIERLLIDIKG